MGFVLCIGGAVPLLNSPECGWRRGGRSCRRAENASQRWADRRIIQMPARAPAIFMRATIEANFSLAPTRSTEGSRIVSVWSAAASPTLSSRACREPNLTDRRPGAVLLGTGARRRAGAESESEANVRPLIEIEDIEKLRRGAGIDDTELREQIHRLRIGDLVRLTLCTEGQIPVRETVVIRLTRIDTDVAFRGKIARNPSARALGALHAGSALVFNVDHIHSVAKGAVRRE
jgi:hypothetical protein